MNDQNIPMKLEPIPEKSARSVRIVRLNTELTRKADNSNEYDVHFDISGNPPQVWRDLFDREWRASSNEELWQKATIRGDLLIMRSPLDEIRTTHLPALKRAVVATNKSFRHHTAERPANFTRREDDLGDERRTVEDLSGSLRFE